MTDMPTYRAPAAPSRRRIASFGDVRHRGLLALLSFALIGVSVLTILGWLHWGGGIHGSVLLPALAGVVLLFQRRGGSLEYLPERAELRIAFQSVVIRRKIRVPVREITGLTVLPSNAKDAKADYELLLLRGAGPRLRLLRAGSAAKLEPARVAVSAFLLENGLLRA
jgi:hypothetical protein